MSDPCAFVRAETALAAPPLVPELRPHLGRSDAALASHPGDAGGARGTTAWLRRLAAAGTTVLLGDPGRSYRPPDRLAELARYPAPTSLDLETRTVCDTAVRVLPA